MKNLIEIVSVYVKYVIFHRFNKITEGQINFIETADWVGKSKTRRLLLDKIKTLNNNLKLK